jgi:hypothetical protein
LSGTAEAAGAKSRAADQALYVAYDDAASLVVYEFRGNVGMKMIPVATTLLLMILVISLLSSRGDKQEGIVMADLIITYEYPLLSRYASCVRPA